MTRSVRLSVVVALSIVFALLAREVMLPHSVVLTTDLWFENLMLSLRTPLFLRLFDGITFFGTAPAVVVITFLWELLCSLSCSAAIVSSSTP